MCINNAMVNLSLDNIISIFTCYTCQNYCRLQNITFETTDGRSSNETLLLFIITTMKDFQINFGSNSL